MSANSNNTPAKKVKGVADIVFLIDATGSMQPCIDDIKNNIDLFIDRLSSADPNGGTMLKDWRISICAYRDFLCDPENGLEHMILNPFVRTAAEAKAQLSAIEADGGGDEPESLLDALYALTTRGVTAKGATESENKWRYPAEAARCIIVFTEATYDETMSPLSGNEGGTVDDIIQILQQERMRLSIFAPAFPCYGALAAVDKSDYEAIDILPGKTPQEALRDFTADRANFKKVLELLAKSVTASGGADTL